MKRITLVLLGLVVACGGKLLAPPSSETVEAGPPADPYAAECVGAAVPPELDQAHGRFYTDASVVAARARGGRQTVRARNQLWADYATKQRWILLPPGTKIDATDPNEWVFPVGTKVWKEFSR